MLTFTGLIVHRNIFIIHEYYFIFLPKYSVKCVNVLVRLKYDIIGLFETRLSSDIAMLHHVPSFDLFTNIPSTLGGGVLVYVRDTLNANKLVNFSVMLEHL